MRQQKIPEQRRQQVIFGFHSHYNADNSLDKFGLRYMYWTSPKKLGIKEPLKFFKKVRGKDRLALIYSYYRFLFDENYDRYDNYTIAKSQARHKMIKWMSIYNVELVTPEQFETLMFPFVFSDREFVSFLTKNYRYHCRTLTNKRFLNKYYKLLNRLSEVG